MKQQPTFPYIYFSIHLCQASSASPSTLQQPSAPSTRSLHISSGRNIFDINETLLLPWCAACKSTSELRNLASSGTCAWLASGFEVHVSLYHRAAPGQAGQLLGTGTWNVSAERLRSVLLPALSNTHSSSHISSSVSMSLDESILARQQAPQSSVSAHSSATVDIQLSLRQSEDMQAAVNKAGAKAATLLQHGTRAIKLKAQQDFHELKQSAMQPALASGASGMSSNFTGLRIGTGVVVERCFVSGTQHEIIRSTVHLWNDLDFPVQVCSRTVNFKSSRLVCTRPWR